MSWKAVVAALFALGVVQGAWAQELEGTTGSESSIDTQAEPSEEPSAAPVPDGPAESGAEDTESPLVPEGNREQALPDDPNQPFASDPDNPVPVDANQPPPLESMIRADRPTLELSLSEAVQLTLSKSLGMRIRGLERVQAEVRIEGAKAGYDAIHQTSVQLSGTESSTTSGLESSSGQIVTKDILLNSFVEQTLPFGGTASVSLRTQRGESNSNFALLPADYGSSLTAVLSYPILRDRRNLTLETAIEQARKNLEFTDLTLRQEVIDAVFQTQDDYLDLILAKENLKVQEQSLALAKNLLEIAQAQERVGTLAPIEVLSAESGVATREEGIIVAESQVLQAEDVLRASLNLPENLAMWDVAIVPTDTPGFPEEQFDFEAAVQQALKMRPDYRQALLNMELQRLDIRLSRDRLRPQLDVSGTFGLIGNSQVGTSLDPNGELVGGPQGGIFTSHLEDLVSLDNFTYGAGFLFRVPLGNRAAQSQHRVDKLELEKALLQLRNLELNIVSQVRALLRGIETNRKRVAASQVAAELARRRLEAEQKKFEVGTATSFDVLQFQEQYVSNQLLYTQAVIDLNRSVLSLQQTLGVNLEANNIRIEEGQAVLSAP